jgi:hypothetical protein
MATATYREEKTRLVQAQIREAESRAAFFEKAGTAFNPSENYSLEIRNHHERFSVDM